MRAIGPILVERGFLQGDFMITIQGVIAELACHCDGARRKDRQGYNKNDTFNGHRLDAMTRANIAWSHDDAETARTYVKRYAVQASRYFTRDAAKQQNLQYWFKNPGKMLVTPTPVPEAEQFNYGALSPERKTCWLIPKRKFDKDLTDSVRNGLRGLAHGERGIDDPRFNDNRGRWEIPYNGTTRPMLLEIMKKHGFIWDREIDCDLDQEFDALMRHSRAAFFANVSNCSMDGKARPHIVFDTEDPVYPFIDAIKEQVPSQMRDYDPDEQVWFVLLTRDIKPVVAGLIERFGFTADASLQRVLTSDPQSTTQFGRKR